jgi:SAM-dependent methyltransferase
MAKKVEEITKKANKKWIKIANNWKKLGPTAKPSMEEIEIYRAISVLELSDKTKVRAVILGSTPELRDMCGRYFSDKIESLVCIDATQDMYQAMSKLVKTKHSKERFIHGNWLDLSNYFESNSIDIIYGDHVVSNVGGNEEKLFSEIKKILKKDGCFASKIQSADVTDEKIKVVPAYHKLKNYAAKLKSGQMNLKTAFTEFGLYLLFSSYLLNKKNEMSLVYWSDQINNLDSQVSKGKNIYEKKILDMCKKIWWNWRDVKWTHYKKSVMHKMLEDNFCIKDEVMTVGHEFTRQTSIYRLKKE